MTKDNLNAKAYKILLQRIVSGEYKPGSTLNEAGLVNDLGISRTPIHSAMIRLQQEHLVEFLPKKGLRVTDITAETIREIHDIRDLIEPYSVREFGRQISKDRLLYFLEVFNGKNSSDTSAENLLLLYESDVSLHMEFVSQTRNKLLCDYYASLQNQFERIANICGQNDIDRLFASNEEHTNIILALLKDDITTAEEAVRKHLRLSREAAYKTLVINSGLFN